EIYRYRFQPEHGFGIQRIYSRQCGADELLLVEHSTLCSSPFGYHPVVAAPGYRLYYLWALAGEGPEMLLQEDPAHAWVARPASAGGRSCLPVTGRGVGGLRRGPAAGAGRQRSRGTCTAGRARSPH